MTTLVLIRFNVVIENKYTSDPTYIHKTAKLVVDIVGQAHLRAV